MDRQALDRLRRFGGSRLIRGMIRTFLDAAPERVVAARRALAAGDTVGVAQAAHALRSSAGQLGAVGLQELCAEVERRAGAGEITAALVEALGEGLAGASEWLQRELDGEAA
jgi:HPt (histidine-containing phosphotransfer) domain-containing protein